MSETLEKLAACKRITEWVNPWDKRLEEIAGIPVPKAGGNIREMWELTDAAEEQAVAQHVGRLLVPAKLPLHGEISARFNNHLFVDGPDMGEGNGNVELEFADMKDWAACFPVHNKTEIFQQHGKRVWAAVALSERVVGLAIFAVEQKKGSVFARVQRVPDEDLERL
ncbi:MAG TPA: hypothetical protein VK978_01690 [Candidatus Saccharimonadales bacterium]|nr:hypothetical protein [Candidatus Saccharimonadales bacterium]